MSVVCEDSYHGVWQLLVMFIVLPPDTAWAVLTYFPDELECPTIRDRKIYNTSIGVSWGQRGRAAMTVPPEFHVDWSSIRGAGMGVFARTFVRKHTWLAEYEGRLLEYNQKYQSDQLSSDYSWVVKRMGVPAYLLDASDEAYSNWLRYINSARYYGEENTKPATCLDKMYYITYRDILPGQELLTNYGVGYLLRLGVDVRGYYREQDHTQHGVRCISCNARN